MIGSGSEILQETSFGFGSGSEFFFGFVTALIEMTCRAQHLGHYLEGQGQNMTLHQNRVRPITLLFKVGF